MATFARVLFVLVVGGAWLYVATYLMAWFWCEVEGYPRPRLFWEKRP